MTHENLLKTNLFIIFLMKNKFRITTNLILANFETYCLYTYIKTEISLSTLKAMFVNTFNHNINY